MSTSREETPLFVSVEEEMIYWKQSYFELDKKYQRLKSCHTCLKEESNGDPPAKRQRIDDDSMDPLKLPEPCTQAIMSFLTGLELLQVMEVSKTWKEYVKTRKSLMNRAMDEVVVRPRGLKGYSSSLIDRLFENDSEKRPVKHLEGPFLLERHILVSPVVNYASTIETLKICGDENYDDIVGPKSSFPKLRKLTVDQKFLHFLNCSFPALKILVIENESHEFDLTYNYLKNRLRRAPELTHIHLSNADKLLEGYPEFEDNIGTSQPKIECMSCSFYNREFVKDQKGSLIELHVEFLDLEDISLCLRELQSLKLLKVGYLEISEESDFHQNCSIESLKIEKLSGDSERLGIESQELLLALPALKELVLGFDLTTQQLKFLASNMLHLELLICKKITEELQEVYQEIKNNPYEYINNTFEFVADPNYNFGVPEELS